MWLLDLAHSAVGLLTWLVPLAFRVPLELVPLELQALLALQAPLVCLVLPDPREPLALQAPQVPPELTGPLALLEPQEPPASLALQVFLAQLGLEPQEPLVFLAQPDPQEPLALTEPLA
jgi:hypothetical protein